MRDPLKVIFAFFVPLLILGCATGEEKLIRDGAQPMSESDKVELNRGNTLYGRYPSGAYFIEYAAPNGNLFLVRSDNPEGKKVYKGEWFKKGGAICYRYDELNAGLPSCFRTYRLDGDIKAVSAEPNKDKSHVWTIYEVKDGDTEGLSDEKE